MNSNLEIIQSTSKVEEYRILAEMAFGDMLPDVDINARYSRAGGGRTIDLPVGDLVNPLYAGLFQITSNPAYDVTIANETVNFLREKEHDTKISLTQVLDYRLWLAMDLKDLQRVLSEHEMNMVKDKIIMDVVDTYLNLLLLENIEASLQNSRIVLEENLRSVKALYRSDLALKSAILEVDVQLMTLDKEILRVQTSKLITAKYLNHLANRNLNDAVDIKMPNAFVDSINRDHLISEFKKNRNELKLIETSQVIYKKEKSIKDAKYLPQVIVKADYGFQGESYEFNSKHDYWMVSGILQYNVFNGFNDQLDSEISEIKIRRSELQFQDIMNRLEIELDQNILNYRQQKQQVSISEKQLSLASENFRIYSGKYRQGLSNQLEFLNAFNLQKVAAINFETDKIELIRKSFRLDSMTGNLKKRFKG